MFNALAITLSNFHMDITFHNAVHRVEMRRGLTSKVTSFFSVSGKTSVDSQSNYTMSRLGRNEPENDSHSNLIQFSDVTHGDIDGILLPDLSSKEFP